MVWNLCAWHATDDDKDANQPVAGKSPDKKMLIVLYQEETIFCYKQKRVIQNYNVFYTTINYTNQHSVMINDNII